MDPVILALLIPFLGTALGAGFVFFMKKDMPAQLQKALLGFASGVMVAASVWSLLMNSVPKKQHMNGPEAHTARFIIQNLYTMLIINFFYLI